MLARTPLVGPPTRSGVRQEPDILSGHPQCPELPDADPSGTYARRLTAPVPPGAHIVGALWALADGSSSSTFTAGPARGPHLNRRGPALPSSQQAREERRGRIGAVTLDLPPELTSAKDVTAAALAILRALAEGRISPENAQRAMTCVDMARNAIETLEFEHRIHRCGRAERLRWRDENGRRGVWHECQTHDA